MSQATCPSCGNSLSSTDDFCSLCGTIIENPTAHDVPTVQISEKPKVGLFLLKVTLLGAGLLTIVVQLTSIFTNASKYPLFKRSSGNITDPYGLTGEHGVLGKQIEEVVKGYEEGSDYHLTSNEYYNIFTFTKDFSYVVDDITANLVLRSDINSSEIVMVEYVFCLDSSHADMWKKARFKNAAKDALISYFDDDPAYYVLYDEEFIQLTKEEFEDFQSKIKSLYLIDWENETENGYIMFSNMYEERANEWSVTFTLKNDIHNL